MHTDESGSAHPVGSSIFNSEFDYKYRQEQALGWKSVRVDSAEVSRAKAYQCLKRVEEQRQGFTQPPSDNNQNGDDEQRDLDTRSNGNTHRQIELPFTCDHHCGRVFRGVGNDGNDNEGDPFLVD